MLRRGPQARGRESREGGGIGLTIRECLNRDDVPHNVISPSTAAQTFNVGTYGHGEARVVTMREPGDVLVLCNIHMEMEAHILVLHGPYFSTVAADGRYQIPAVPAGTYTLKLWRPAPSGGRTGHRAGRGAARRAASS